VGFNRAVLRATVDAVPRALLPIRLLTARLLPAALLSAVPLPAASPAGTAAAPTPTPTPTPAPLTMPDMPLHDPWIVADGARRTYWLFTRNERRMTGDGRLGIMAYTSRDLAHWTRPRVVFALPAPGTPGATWAKDGAWAPEVHRWRGRWYLFATFHDEGARLPDAGARRPYRRATILAVADRPGGPFVPVRGGAPVAPADRMTLDGTLWVEKGRPWMVYAREWLQVADGAVEAVPLDDALAAAGPPVHLFRASDAPWVDGKPQPAGDTAYVTDGPELFRTRAGTLLMLWSSYDRDGYVQALARSRTGRVEGPWEQLPPLLRGDSGHGMIFRRFDGRPMLVVHRPFKNARGHLYEVRDLGDRIVLSRQATELDRDARPVAPEPDGAGQEAGREAGRGARGG